MRRNSNLFERFIVARNKKWPWRLHCQHLPQPIVNHGSRPRCAGHARARAPGAPQNSLILPVSIVSIHRSSKYTSNIDTDIYYQRASSRTRTNRYTNRADTRAISIYYHRASSRSRTDNSCGTRLSVTLYNDTTQTPDLS